MTASLRQDILAMKETKQLPSFVQVLVLLEQVLVTLEGAQAEVEQLIGAKAALQVEIERLRGLTDDQQAEITRLQLENDRLWQAIRDGRVVGSIT